MIAQGILMHDVCGSTYATLLPAYTAYEIRRQIGRIGLIGINWGSQLIVNSSVFLLPFGVLWLHQRKRYSIIPTPCRHVTIGVHQQVRAVSSVPGRYGAAS